MGNFMSKKTTDLSIHPEIESINRNDTTVIYVNDEKKDVLNDPTNALLDQLEKEGYKKLGEICTTAQPVQDFGDALMSIIESGNNKFKETTGRPMTYSEMRQAYG